MSIKKLFIAVALLSAAASAQAGWMAAIPESATVTLVFIAMGTIAFLIRQKRKTPVEEQ